MGEVKSSEVSVLDALKWNWLIKVTKSFASDSLVQPSYQTDQYFSLSGHVLCPQ